MAKKKTPIDKNNKLVNNPFSFKITKEEKLMVYRNNKLVKTFPRKSALLFLEISKSGNEEAIQLALAKMTGHYKH